MTAQAIQALYNQITSLKNSEEPLHFRGKLMQAFIRQFTSELENLLNQPDNLAVNLKNLLEKNWKQINGSILCPTCYPEHPLCLLLCDTANLAAHEWNKDKSHDPLGALNLLMPGVCTQSLSEEKCPHLGSYEDWDEQRNAFHTINPNVDLQTILKTHILGEKGYYLIPASMLPVHLNAARDVDRHNPYFDYKQHPECSYINKDELERLCQHAPDTRAYYDAWHDFLLWKINKSHLLGRLNQLTHNLFMNSAGFGGEEEDAGDNVYSAILRFKEYWELIDFKDKNCLPENLHKEICLLLDLSFNLDQNSNATKNMDTCIATRRQKLLDAMNNHEALLSSISPTKESGKSFIESLKKTLDSASEKLMNSTQSGTFLGSKDKLPVQRHLLEWLNVSLTVSCMEDVYDIGSLSAEELSELADGTDLADSITDQFNTFEDLVVFAVDAKIPVLNSILNLCSKTLAEKFTIKEILSIYSILDVEKALTVAQAFKNQTKTEDIWLFMTYYASIDPNVKKALFNLWKQTLEVLNKASHITVLLNFLPEYGYVLWESIKEKELFKLIENGEQLGLLMACATEPQREEIWKKFKTEVFDMIPDVYHLGILMSGCSNEQNNEILEKIKPKLWPLIANGENLGTLLSGVPKPFAHQIWEFCSPSLSNYIETLRDLGKLITKAPEIYQEPIIKTWLPILSQLPKTPRDVSDFLEKIKGLSLQEILPNLNILIPDTDFLLTTLSLIKNKELCKTIWENQKNRFIFPDVSSFMNDLKRMKLTTDKQKALLDLTGMNENIKTIHEFTSIYSFVDPEIALKFLPDNRKDVIGLLNNHNLPGEWKREFAKILAPELSFCELIDVLKTTKDKAGYFNPWIKTLCSLISDFKEFEILIAHTPESCLDDTCHYLTGNMLKFVKNSSQCAQLFNFKRPLITPEEKKEALSILIKDIETVLKDLISLSNILNHCSPAEGAELLTAGQHLLKSLIFSDDFEQHFWSNISKNSQLSFMNIFFTSMLNELDSAHPLHEKMSEQLQNFLSGNSQDVRTFRKNCIELENFCSEDSTSWFKTWAQALERMSGQKPPSQYGLFRNKNKHDGDDLIYPESPGFRSGRG